MKTLLRWIFLMPISAGAALVSYFIVRLWVFLAPWVPFEWLEKFTLWWMEIIASYFLGTTFLITAYIIAPKHKVRVTYAVALFALLFIAACVWGDWIKRHQFQARSVVGVLLGLIQGLCEAHSAENKRIRALQSPLRPTP